MKKILLILLVAPVLSFAKSIESMTSNMFFQADKITLQPLCPKGNGIMCVVDGTIITLEYVVDCTEEMTSFEHQVIEGPNGEVDVVVAAKKESKVFPMHLPVCKSISFVKKQITLANLFIESEGNVYQLGSPKLGDIDKIEDVMIVYPH